MEDLRELSPALQREEIDEENWMITFFGDTTAPATAPPTPVPGTPAPGTPPPGTPLPAGQLQLQDRSAEAEQNTTLAPYEGVDKFVEMRVMKPVYSVKRILQKLPELAKNDEIQAKRLILGLHEKMWHSTASDLSSLLLRAGIPPHVTDLVGAAVSSCSICRKYSRLPSKPKTKATLASCFLEMKLK